jgi:hypothetical protein
MAVLSVDLSYRNWSDLGVVILSRSRRAVSASTVVGTVHCEIIPMTMPDGGNGSTMRPRKKVSAFSEGQETHHAPSQDAVDPEILAGILNHLCMRRGIRVLLLDGPQAWKSRSNGLLHARVSERRLNTAAKTGLPGVVKPLTYRPFAEFCMDVYDALSRRGWRRLDTNSQPAQSAGPEGRVLVESSPNAAWKSLGIKPLPTKRRARVSDLAEAYGALRAVIAFSTNRPPNHDQLQAIVAGLPGIALEEQNPAAMQIVGRPPHREDGHWREGFIVLPVAPHPAPAGVRWLH